MSKNVKIKKSLSILVGALLGYIYYYFIGCYSGTCPISSNPYVATLYGALIGLIWPIPIYKKNGKQKDDN
ncbi:MAG: DUF6132 family protein [Melioribacter sp.]|nr:DUF6132 family protein [Melioribacter sp.]